jgi:hypothetical protein
MQTALGADWNKLPAALQAHYRYGPATDSGYLNIDYPRWMQPCLSALRLLGALVDRRGERVDTVLNKTLVGNAQYWRRTMIWRVGDSGLVNTTRHFNSTWVAASNSQLIEYVKPWLGLRMEPRVVDGRLHYRGVCFVLKLGSCLLPIPEWLLLGHTTIIEEAVDERHFNMDFRMTHPLFGEMFRYWGQFEADAGAVEASA